MERKPEVDFIGLTEINNISKFFDFPKLDVIMVTY